ncbi:hypothetical protein R5R35_000120 [Gryllus longicercus]
MMLKELIRNSRRINKYFCHNYHLQVHRNYNFSYDRLKEYRGDTPTRLLNSAAGNAVAYNNFITLDNSLNPKPLNFNLIWLRDHCRCPECYNYSTNQKRCSILDIAQNASVKECTVENNILKIIWTDNHKSTFSLEWLSQFYNNTKKCECPVLWNKRIMKSLNIKSIDVKDFLYSDKGILELLTSVLRFGVGFIKNVLPTKEATEQVIQKISHTQRTFFGDMWEFTDSLDHEDTAYTRDALGAHTDNTYFSEAAGLQVFHCLHHDGEGGETLLVDGFYVAKHLKEKYPTSYQRLTSTFIESEFKEAEKHYLACGPILKLNSITGELEQVRFNMYDRAPLKTVAMENMQDFYEDFINLSKIICDPQNEWWFKLQPGTVLIFNNWRVLHGRAAYTGHRRIAGCYIGYSDWHSKARTLGLL